MVYQSGTPRRRRLLPVVAALAATALFVGPGAAVTPTTGPSTVTNPYLVPVAAGVHLTSLLTVNDGAATNGYRLVGNPDGLGAMQQGANLVLYMNHELRPDRGIERRHGQIGAFVSRWVIDPSTLEVKEGSDLINPGVLYWDYPSGAYVTAGAQYADGALQALPFGRFCSATLSDPGQFDNPATGNGWHGQIYFGNEESENGRTFAVTREGNATALPRVGLFESENTKPAHNASDTTLVMGQEDGPADGSQLWVYVGTKQQIGPPVAKAGLTNGTDYVIAAADAAVTSDAQWRSTYGKGVSAAVGLAEVDWNQTGTAANAEAKADGLSLNRIEDGHWDPNSPNDFYFVTTEGSTVQGTGVNSRDGGGLWRLRFDDIEQPMDGGNLTLLLDGTELIADGQPRFNKPDNMTIDTHGNLLIQEDPGNNNHLARIVAYRISDGKLAVLARFDPALFGPGSNADPNRLTIDEESSGIIDTESMLGAGTFLFNALVHTAKGLPPGTGPGTVQEFFQRGQLLRLIVDDWSAVYPA